MLDFGISLRTGIPLTDQYAAVIKSKLFADLESSSRSFLSANPIVQKTYGWVQDPLHQWSRQWEYPFILQYIEQQLSQNEYGSPQILDAGSGITFFPYFLKNRSPGASVTCCDYDSSLDRVFSHVGQSLPPQSQVAFHCAPLQKLPFDDERFSIVYCISVLEHTTDYLAVVREFHRVLKPGGLFLATFDIALDGISEILPTEADRLHECILSRFRLSEPTPNPSEVPSDGITSRNIGEADPSLLPWRYPFLSMIKSALKRRSVPSHWRKHLTVFCCSYRKPE